jgi:hypothetical protein
MPCSLGSLFDMKQAPENGKGGFCIFKGLTSIQFCMQSSALLELSPDEFDNRVNIHSLLSAKDPA